MCILFLSLIFLICLFLVLRTIHPLYAAKNGKFQEDVHSPDAELQWVGLIVSRSNRFALLKGRRFNTIDLTPEGVGQDPEGCFHEQTAVVAAGECRSRGPLEPAHEGFHQPAFPVTLFL